MKTGIYKPFVKDGELWGKEINKVPKPETEYDAEGHPHYPLQEYIDEWQQAEQSLQSFKVNKSEYGCVGMFRPYRSQVGYVAWIERAEDFITESDSFRATLKDNKLINLEVL